MTKSKTMTELDRNKIQFLIPDILPLDHVSLSAKRIRFIRGQGIILFNDIYAVEIYLPMGPDDTAVFFGVQRHQGKIKDLGEYFRKLEVRHYDDPKTTEEMQTLFDEAIFQYQPLPCFTKEWILPQGKNVENLVSEPLEVYLREQLSGAA